jgi:hypothetical protein
MLVDSKTELEHLVKARYPIIYINSSEEERVERAIVATRDALNA